MDKKTLFTDNISESKAARWAYRISLIPILGLPLYMLFAFIALIRISRKGMTGLRLLRLGLFRSIRLTIVGVLAVAAWWFCPKHHSVHELKREMHWFSHKHVDYIGGGYKNFDEGESPYHLGSGYMMRTWEWPEKYVRVGTWTYYYTTITSKTIDDDKYKTRYLTLSKVKSRVENFWSGKLNGVWKSWYPNGSLAEVQNYKNGKRDGEYFSNYKNGMKEEQGQYEHGNKIGLWTNWFENGVQKKERTFVNNKEDGKHIEWYENGRKCIKGYVKEGFMVGEWKEWHENGQLKSQNFYASKPHVIPKESVFLNIVYEKRIKTEGHVGNDVLGTWSEWYDNGQLKSETYYKDEKNSLKQITWYKNGQKKSEEYNNDYEIIWHENGQKKSEGIGDFYKQGKWVTWHPNGKKESEGSYKKGNKLGNWTEWYENGVKKFEGEFLAGEYPSIKQGKHAYWYEDGSKMSEENYNKNKYHGDCAEWNEYGNKMFESNWNDGVQKYRVSYKNNQKLKEEFYNEQSGYLERVIYYNSFLDNIEAYSDWDNQYNIIEEIYFKNNIFEKRYFNCNNNLIKIEKVNRLGIATEARIISPPVIIDWEVYPQMKPLK